MNERRAQHNRRAWVAACALLLLPALATARAIHYGAVRDAGVLACDRQYWRGQVVAAENCYVALLDGSSTAAVKAEAAWALNELQT
ncbi:MAG: hypothetical protein OEO82_02460, partial [Gammaproteobacteria bacterium]|nr:hypothetical protein [Gammaproteobacteria bacterium]